MTSLSKRLLALSFTLFLVAGCVGCAKFWKVSPAVLKTAECALDLAHKGAPWEKVVIECGVTPENEQAILDLIAQDKAHEAAIRREVGCKQ
jgi:hypothetical protein